MGAAAYYRGSKVISEQIHRDFPAIDPVFQIMDRINSMAKKPISKADFLRGKRRPLLKKYTIEHDRSRNVWWMMNPDNMYEGHALCYPTLKDVITSWDDLFLTEYSYETNQWTAEVI